MLEDRAQQAQLLPLLLRRLPCRHRSLLGRHKLHLPTAVLIHPLPQHFDRSWLAHATVKALMYEVEATIQVGTCCRLLLSAIL